MTLTTLNWMEFGIHAVAFCSAVAIGCAIAEGVLAKIQEAVHDNYPDSNLDKLLSPSAKIPKALHFVGEVFAKLATFGRDYVKPKPAWDGKDRRDEFVAKTGVVAQSAAGEVGVAAKAGE